MTTERNIRQLVRRNFLQDIAIARSLQGEYNEQAYLSSIAAALGLETTQPISQSFCNEDIQLPVGERGAEWYVSIRSWLYRAASNWEFVWGGWSGRELALLH